MPQSAAGRIAHFTRQYGVLFAADAAAWGIGILAALVLRFDFNLMRIHWGWTLVVIGITALLQLAAGWLFSLYRNRYQVGSFDEVRVLVLDIVVVMTVAWLFAYVVGYGNGIPRSTLFIAAPITFSLMGVARYVARLYVERQMLPGSEAERTLLYGAGYLGVQTAKRLLTDAKGSALPVGFIDDDPKKRRQEVRGVRVLGGFDDLADVARRTRATKLIVCIGDADAGLMRRVDEAANRAGMTALVLPPLDQILRNNSVISDLRQLSIEDLIGRHPVRLDTESIASYLQDRRVLVTGAGGSIGSELCRQLARFAPRELIMLDRDETSLQETQLSISGHGLLDTNDVVLADIRDAGALERLFLERRPEVVFHAAALKHLPMLEQYPDEAWKTNVLGTLNVLRAAQAAEVSTFVNISTDKAANPTSVLGHSKRVAEKLTAWMAERTGQRYLSVRFGNVIGSRGSMLPTFRKLIDAGGPVTVTHPNVTRFFMTIPEACQLVVQAGGIGRPGEVLILDMGEPVSILDVAKRMIAQSGRDVDIVFTGLRHGEKLHEELVGDGEGDERPYHPKISHARVDSISPSVLDHEGWVARMDLTAEAEERVQ
ncbi:polysaccharide biosynthesis protein [Leucobacter chromiiresistens]|uniref:Capsule biosynthesis protein CapD n=1 Tax=Leucobacter chromiiresistens TaxID=1079994 RepID=A0A147EMU1_9MICO|nr:nucleoside-diphosphate sugar epimerase/dehydratase [Leucobacter chromiiresistens]KTR85640.1 capsule biosynthesis protein CapD [Leucobacter chromiiresistens]